MIRQICPSCFQSVELPDSVAGTTAPCPACGKSFAIPAGYTPVVDADRLPPPPGLVPPGLVIPPAAPPSSLEEPTGYSRSASMALSPTWVAWVPALALTGVLLLTFFAWVGTFPAGYRLFTQNPWQAMLGWVSLEDKFDQTLKERPALAAELSGNWLLALYFPLLIAGVAVAWADRAGLTPNPSRVPHALAGMARLWPYRLILLTVLSALALVLIVVQAASGFGLQTVIEARIAAAVAAAEAAPNPPALPYLQGEQIGHFGLGGTTARDLALTLHGITVLALFSRLWLDSRGAKPLPKLAAHW